MNKSTQLVVSEEVTKLKMYLDDMGIKRVWLAEKLGYEKSWTHALFKGKMALSQENRERIEELLNISLATEKTDAA